MRIFDLFSKKQKRLRGEVPDIYVYDEIPRPLRVQIVHIIRDAIGIDNYAVNTASKVYEFINDTLCREYGLFELVKNAGSHDVAIFNFFLNCDDFEHVLDVVQVSFKMIDSFVRDSYNYNTTTKCSPDEVINELNFRFKEHGIGYQFESGELIRIDSQYIHSEAIKPTIDLLRGKMYCGANDEFLKAHEHYRHGRYKETLNEALKAFESVMKAICTKHKWQFNQTDTAKTLIQTCLNHNLIPAYLQSEFTSLRSVLESGIPTVRNKLGGHGQGAITVTVSEKMARYALNLTAANILFLAEHEKDL